MTNNNLWLKELSKVAVHTDSLKEKANHISLLAMGLAGEAGSILTEIKKNQRELDAYPDYRDRINEEIGDFLWYFVRLCDLQCSNILTSLPYGNIHIRPIEWGEREKDNIPLQLISCVGDIATVINKYKDNDISNVLRGILDDIWQLLLQIEHSFNVSLREAAHFNIDKVLSRWPIERKAVDLFDNEFPECEQIPRKLTIEFLEVINGSKVYVVLRHEGVNIGNRLTDNVEVADDYRYHDVFHLAYAACLGWSPVVRALLQCKRKSDPKKDEEQDGARGAITEEAVSALIFSRAKSLKFYDEVDRVDYDLLKVVQSLVKDFEVSLVPLWQWEDAIMQGYKVFRMLRDNNGGSIRIDLNKRKIEYITPDKI